MLVIIITASASAEPELYIAVGDNRESKIIERFYANKFAEMAPSIGKTERLDIIRNRLIPNIVVVRWDDLEAKKKYRIPNLGVYPQYRFTKYATEWKEFDPRVWESISLLPDYLTFLINDYHHGDIMLAREEDIEKYKWHIYREYDWVKVMVYADEVDYIYDYDMLLEASTRLHRENKQIPLIPLIAEQPISEFQNPLDF